VTCEWCRRARGAPARAPATWNDGVDGALLCDLLFSLHDDQAHGAMQVLAVLLYRLHSGIGGRVKLCADTHTARCSTRAISHASTFSLLLLYVVKLYDVSVHLDLCARSPCLANCLVAVNV
jgi:hypothetical protein